MGELAPRVRSYPLKRRVVTNGRFPFIHGASTHYKVCVADDTHFLCGSANALDECYYMHDTPAVTCRDAENLFLAPAMLEFDVAFTLSCSVPQISEYLTVIARAAAVGRAIAPPHLCRPVRVPHLPRGCPQPRRLPRRPRRCCSPARHGHGPLRLADRRVSNRARCRRRARVHRHPHRVGPTSAPSRNSSSAGSTGARPPLQGGSTASGRPPTGSSMPSLSWSTTTSSSPASTFRTRASPPPSTTRRPSSSGDRRPGSRARRCSA